MRLPQYLAFLGLVAIGAHASNPGRSESNVTYFGAPRHILEGVLPTIDITEGYIRAQTDDGVGKALGSPTVKQCSINNPCKDGSCCNTNGQCGFRHEHCRPASPNRCVSNCDAKAPCGEFSKDGQTSCPLNLCCSFFGTCGPSELFCRREPQSGADTPCQGNCAEAPTPSCGTNSGTASRRIAYYEAWNSRRRSCDKIMPSQIDTSGLTHIVLAFATIDPKTFEIQLMHPDDEKIYEEFLALPGSVSKWIGIGGWEFTDPGATQHAWSEMSSTKQNRETFIKSLQQFLAKWKFQGIDIDWEWPGASSRGGQPEDGTNQVNLVTELRQALSSEIGLSVVLPAQYEYLKAMDPKSLEAQVSWISILTYDLHGPWDASMPGLGPLIKPHTDLAEIDSALKLLWSANVTPSKVNLGVANYGRGFTVSDKNCMWYGCQYTGPNKAGTCTDMDGVLSACEIKRVVAQKNLTPHIISGGAGVKEISWDDQWIAYDDQETLGLKLELANNRCLGGTALWAIDYDICGGGITPRPGSSVVPSPPASVPVSSAASSVGQATSTAVPSLPPPVVPSSQSSSPSGSTVPVTSQQSSQTESSGVAVTIPVSSTSNGSSQPFSGTASSSVGKTESSDPTTNQSSSEALPTSAVESSSGVSPVGTSTSSAVVSSQSAQTSTPPLPPSTPAGSSSSQSASIESSAASSIQSSSMSGSTISSMTSVTIIGSSTTSSVASGVASASSSGSLNSSPITLTNPINSATPSSSTMIVPWLPPSSDTSPSNSPNLPSTVPSVSGTSPSSANPSMTESPPSSSGSWNLPSDTSTTSGSWNMPSGTVPSGSWNMPSGTSTSSDSLAMPSGTMPSGSWSISIPSGTPKSSSSWNMPSGTVSSGSWNIPPETPTSSGSWNMPSGTLSSGSWAVPIPSGTIPSSGSWNVPSETPTSSGSWSLPSGTLSSGSWIVPIPSGTAPSSSSWDIPSGTHISVSPPPSLTGTPTASNSQSTSPGTQNTGASPTQPNPTGTQLPIPTSIPTQGPDDTDIIYDSDEECVPNDCLAECIAWRIVTFFVFKRSVCPCIPKKCDKDHKKSNKKKKCKFLGCGCGWMGLPFGPGCKGPDLDFVFPAIDLPCGIFGCSSEGICAIWGCPPDEGGQINGILGYGGYCKLPEGCEPCPPAICSGPKCTRAGGCGPKPGPPPSPNPPPTNPPGPPPPGSPPTNPATPSPTRKPGECEEKDKVKVTERFIFCTEGYAVSALPSSIGGGTSSSLISTACVPFVSATLTVCPGVMAGYTTTTTKSETTTLSSSEAPACTRAPLSLDDDEGDNMPNSTYISSTIFTWNTTSATGFKIGTTTTLTSATGFSIGTTTTSTSATGFKIGTTTTAGSSAAPSATSGAMDKNGPWKVDLFHFVKADHSGGLLWTLYDPNGNQAGQGSELSYNKEFSLYIESLNRPTEQMMPFGVSVQVFDCQDVDKTRVHFSIKKEICSGAVICSPSMTTEDKLEIHQFEVESCFDKCKGSPLRPSDFWCEDLNDGLWTLDKNGDWSRPFKCGWKGF